MKKKISAVLFGLIIIAIGVILIGNAAFGWGISLSFKGWWAMLLMLMFLFMIINDRPRMFNVLGLVIFGLLFARYYIPVLGKINIWLVVCGAAILYVGVLIIYHAVFKNHSKKTSSDVADSNDSVAFKSADYDFHGKTFSGGKYDCAFGSIRIDLRGSTITVGSVLDLNCSFGKIEVYADKETKIGIKSDSSFGAVKCNAPLCEDGTEDIKINASCSFGAIEISC